MSLMEFLEAITPLKQATWEVAYAPLDVRMELSKMLEWIAANPRKRKRNWERFAVNWLNRAHERETARQKEAEKLTQVGAKGKFVDYSEECKEILRRHPDLA